MEKIEEEIRIKIRKEDINEIKKYTLPYKEKIRLLDITCGKYGFESLNKLGYICRIRCKGNDHKLEIKKYIDDNKCIEKSIKIKNVKDTIELLSMLDIKPYLVLDRYREVRKYNDLLIYIDEFSLIGPYLEIEYQNSKYENVLSFLKSLNLNNEQQNKYGDIIKEKLENDEEFSVLLKKELKNTIERF